MFNKIKISLLIAILSKRLGLHLGQQDVYVNVAGGLKISEPAADLAAAAAIISSFHEKPLPQKTCLFGELGLGGEVRPVSFFDKRLREAENMGFKKVICPNNPHPTHSSLHITSLTTVHKLSSLLKDE